MELGFVYVPNSFDKDGQVTDPSFVPVPKMGEVPADHTFKHSYDVEGRVLGPCLEVEDDRRGRDVYGKQL